MRRYILTMLTGAILAAASPAAAQRPEPTTPEPAPVVNADIGKVASGRYQISGYHSQVVFWVMHQMVSPYYMRFNKASGSVELNTANPERSALNVELALSDLSTPFYDAKGEPYFDRVLCKPEMLDCEKHKTINFRSTGIRRTGASTGDITGTLTIKGVSRPVTLHATFHGSTKGMGGGDLLGFSATGSFKRSDFGLTEVYYNRTVSDVIEVLVEAELSQPRPPAQPAQPAQ